MAYDDLSVDGAARDACHTATTSPSAGETLKQWDRYIARCAERATEYVRGDPEDAHDAAQKVRVRLLRAAERSPDAVANPAFVKRVIRNAIRNVIREKETQPVSVDLDCDEVADAAASAGDPLCMAVRVWLRTLPPRKLRICELIYGEGMTQREVGLALGISQPRVLELHNQILKEGLERFRDEF